MSDKSPQPQAVWGARSDIPLNTLLMQMANAKLNFVEIPMGPTFVSITISSAGKQPGLRELIHKYLSGGS